MAKFEGVGATDWEVIDAVRREGVATKADVVAMTGLSWSTVKASVKTLVDRGIVSEGAPKPTGRTGPKARRYSLKSSAGVFVGVELGPARMRASVFDFAFDGPPLEVPSPEFPGLETGDSVSEFLSNVSALVDQCAAADKKGRDILGVGFAWPGGVDHDAAMFRSGPSLRFDTEGLQARDLLASEMQSVVPSVVVDNEAESLALAEMERTPVGGRGEDEDIVVVSLGFTLGAGLVLGGELYRGSGSAAGAVGHLVVDPSPRGDAPTCWCGRRGCLEQGVSVGAVLRDSGVELTELLDQPPEITEKLLGEVSDDAYVALGEALAVGLSHVVNLLNPSVVIVGGLLATQYDRFYPTLRERLGDLVWRYAGQNLRIERSHLGPFGVRRGAALSACREFSQPR